MRSPALLLRLCAAALVVLAVCGAPSPTRAQEDTFIYLPVVTVPGVVVSAGWYHSCAVTAGGAARCWGHNGHGQLGNGGNGERCDIENWATCMTTPGDVWGLDSVVASVDTGSRHSCALTTTGGVMCWGSGYFGQLGSGTQNGSNTPVQVIGLRTGVAGLATGGYHTCALTTAGGVKCWGSNVIGQLGNGGSGVGCTPPGTDLCRLSPVDVVGLSRGVVAISAGLEHTCAVTASGGVTCWGSNLFGQIGGGFQWSTVPRNVTGLGDKATAVSAGEGHTCALTAAGGVMCWGRNGSGQLGNPDVVYYSSQPVDVTGLISGVAAISAGDDHTCAVTNAGGVKCWGDNSSGQLGNGEGGGIEPCGVTTAASCQKMPVDVVGLTSGVVAVSAGGYHTCAVTALGGVKCWGDGYFGQLGNGEMAESYLPVDVAGFAE